MITVKTNGSIAHLIIDMPGRSMNVLTLEFVDALQREVLRLAADATVSGIVISSGKSSFIAGADLGQMAGFADAGMTAEAVLEKVRCYGDVFRKIETCGKPLVAAASGTALGGGLELMLACHYRIAANEPKAVFGLPEVKLGLLPGAGGTQRIPRLVGIAQAIPLLTKGTALGVAEALKLGILNEVVAPADLLVAAEKALLDGRVKAAAPWDEKGYRLPGGDSYSAANSNAFVAANSTTQASQGNYPAPYVILRCVYEGTRVPIDKGLRIEQQHFVGLVQGRVAQNMIRTLFFAKQSADKLARRPADVPKVKMRKLGILGAGFMGAGIAQVSALAGIDVMLLDRDMETATRGRDGIATALNADVEKGRLKPEARDAALARIGAAGSYDAFGDCDLVIEAVLEDTAVKADVIKAAEAAMPATAIFASNTSALPIGELAASSVRPKNFVGLHFFSPVARMALVEIIVGKETSAETLARALDYVQQLRKTPIVVNDGPGFYTSRCVDAYIREGIRLLADGVNPVVIENAGVILGMPVGPLSLADEVGVDVIHHISHFFRSRETGAWADDRHQMQNPVVDTLYAAKRFGRKSGHGFYVYPGGAPKTLDPALRGGRNPDLDEVKDRLLYAQVVEAARCWAEGVIVDTVEADLGAHLAWAFPSYLGGPFACIDAMGAADFVRKCDDLVSRFGPRFEVPGKLRDFAVEGRKFCY